VAGRRPSFLRPEAGSRGLATADPVEALAIVRAAYSGVAELARTVNLDGYSRIPGHTRRDMLVPLGDWEEHTFFAGLVEDARFGRSHDLDDDGARNRMIVAAHTDATADDLVLALERTIERAEAFLASAEAETVGRMFSSSPVGPLPVTSIIVASAFEAAVHALDVAAPENVPAQVLDAGVAALVDTTGALAARHRISTTFAVRTPSVTWAAGSHGDSWTTAHLHPQESRFDWPGVRGHAADVIEAASGRANPAQLVLSRKLRVHDIPALLTLLPALEDVPGMGGGTAAKAALRALGQTGRLFGQLSRLTAPDPDRAG